MRYSGLKFNDIVNGEGICVSLWTQGCPHKCVGCHNPETWSFKDGLEVPDNRIDLILDGISKDGIQRNFSVLGGEPLAYENLEFVLKIVSAVRDKYPNIKIFIWTGYTFEELLDFHDAELDLLLTKIDILIDGKFIKEQKDLSLKLRGSSNQRIIDLKNLCS